VALLGTQQTARWREKLQDYDYERYYIAGNDLKVAYGLSQAIGPWNEFGPDIPEL